LPVKNKRFGHGKIAVFLYFSSLFPLHHPMNRRSAPVATLWFVAPQRPARLLPWLCALLLVALSTHPARAQQDPKAQMQLGVNYYQQEEFDKAAEVLEQLLKTHPGERNAYNYLYAAYSRLGDYKRAESMAAFLSKKFPEDIQFVIDQGVSLRQQNKETKALAVFEDIFRKLPADRNRLLTYAFSFQIRAENDFAIRVYEQGARQLNDPQAFTLELAELYRATGQKARMVENYLEYLVKNPQQMAHIQKQLQSNIAAEDFEVFREKLMAALQKYPDDLQLPELAVWYFVQQKDFSLAFVQARALDTRKKEGGSRLLTLAATATENRDYTAADDIYRYLIEAGPAQPVWFDARMNRLDNSQLMLERDRASRELWSQLAEQYRLVLADVRHPNLTLPLKKGLARILAYEIGQFEAGIQLLEEAIAGPGDARKRAEAKLELADLFLLTDELWESQLLYGQVDKDYPEDVIGQEARLRNARLSYFRHEFELAQAQLDILKAGTTHRISNDAMELSLLIADNFNLDTTQVPLMKFAEAELRMKRQQYDQAIRAFDSLLAELPGHSLRDEIWFRKAGIQEKTGDPAGARLSYESLLKDHPRDILADDALIALARLAEREGKPEEAQQLYQKLLEEYPDSLFTVDARRRYRELRGDSLNVD
jgi:tetratricopeptide (TPR) repeat protein